MGLFNRLFSPTETSDKTKPKLDWTPLNSLEQIEELESISAGKKVLIFKHSTRCGISSMVLKQFEKKFQANENTALYFLDLLRHRNVSNTIAERFSVTHQSPQLLIIENGACTTQASHYGIVEFAED